MALTDRRLSGPQWTGASSSRIIPETTSEEEKDEEFPERSVAACIWELRVGRVPLYLLDTDLPENSEWDRGLTASLYGGDKYYRLCQEAVLGIGGMSLFKAETPGPMKDQKLSEFAKLNARIGLWTEEHPWLTKIGKVMAPWSIMSPDVVNPLVSAGIAVTGLPELPEKQVAYQKSDIADEKNPITKTVAMVKDTFRRSRKQSEISSLGVEAMLRDQNTVLTVSTLMTGQLGVAADGLDRHAIEPRRPGPDVTGHRVDLERDGLGPGDRDVARGHVHRDPAGGALDRDIAARGSDDRSAAHVAECHLARRRADLDAGVAGHLDLDRAGGAEPDREPEPVLAELEPDEPDAIGAEMADRPDREASLLRLRGDAGAIGRRDDARLGPVDALDPDVVRVNDDQNRTADSDVVDARAGSLARRGALAGHLSLRGRAARPPHGRSPG